MCFTVKCPTRWRQRSLNLSSLPLPVQDATEYTETAEENSHNEEDEEDEEEDEEEGEVPVSEPSCNESIPLFEVVRSVEELKAELPLREVRTPPPPPRVPAKLLPRLGSLDSQYHMTIKMKIWSEMEIFLLKFNQLTRTENWSSGYL